MASNRRDEKPPVETVQIDREAMLRLEQARGTDESFSEVIKRCVHPRRSAEQILRAMRRAAVSSATLRSIEQSAARRRRTGYKSKV